MSHPHRTSRKFLLFSGHGDHGGEVVNPSDHINADLSGLRADNSAVIGDRLTYTITLKDSTGFSSIEGQVWQCRPFQTSTPL